VKLPRPKERKRKGENKRRRWLNDFKKIQEKYGENHDKKEGEEAKTAQV
jgi:hypothetical protein